jgi:hypothetical protein
MSLGLDELATARKIFCRGKFSKFLHRREAKVLLAAQRHRASGACIAVLNTPHFRRGRAS